MKKFVVMLLASGSCNSNTKLPAPASKKDSTIIIHHDTIPETRTSTSKTPVASYSEKVADDLNDWVFAVDVYETKQTFSFLMKIQYEELRVSDTLNIPNFGINPKVEIHKAADKYSCIVGFLDKENIFKEYKLVSAKNNKLKVTALKHYTVGVYKTEQFN